LCAQEMARKLRKGWHKSLLELKLDGNYVIINILFCSG
jgi:hypothetical protein